MTCSCPYCTYPFNGPEDIAEHYGECCCCGAKVADNADYPVVPDHLVEVQR